MGRMSAPIHEQLLLGRWVLEARSKYLLRKGDEAEQVKYFAKTAAHYRERLDEWIYAVAKGKKPRPC